MTEKREKRLIKGGCLSDYCDGLQGSLIPIFDLRDLQEYLVGYRLELSLRPHFGAPIAGAVYYSSDPRPYLTQTSHCCYRVSDSTDLLLGRFKVAPHAPFHLPIEPYRTGNIKALLDLGSKNDTGGGTYRIRIPVREGVE
ncbi:MAG: hypothetical protein HY282_13110 [Nitrospirae bacterium]|nr:hypothetical protein [Candidatus Manganitrophaceae bacterium]